jgi:hypothetical protein
MYNVLVQQENADKMLRNFDFEHPFRVTERGTIADDVAGIYAPHVLDERVESTSWEPVTGYSGQDRYAGPVMHDSEYLGDGMLRDMLANPGIYVQVACFWSGEENDEGPSSDGWMLLKYIA